MHILVVGPLGSGFMYFSAGKEMGMKMSAITTAKEPFAVPEEVRRSIDTLITIEDHDVNRLVGAVCRLHKDDPIDGIVAGVEFVVEQTAVIADVLGLPFTRLEDIPATRNKAVMRQRLLESGLRTPKFARAVTALDLEHVAKTVGFPAVVKPLNLAGSIGVARVDDPTELLAAYEDITNESEGFLGVESGTEVVVEEFLVGDEYIADGYVASDGEIVVFEFGKYEMGPQPHFQIIGCTMYHPNDVPEADAITSYIQDVVRAVGITVGPFHAELILTDEGPVLVEIANRLPGGRLPELSERVTGVSFAKSVLASITNRPIPKRNDRTMPVAALYNIVPSPEMYGTAYRRLDGWEDIAKNPLVDEAAVFIQPGATIPPYADERSWIACIYYHADNVSEAEAFRKKIEEVVHVVT